MPAYYAAIDVGSYELELSIYEITAKTGIKRIDQVRHVLSLGSDTYVDGEISYQTVNEMCQVLSDFRRVMKEYQITEYQACATSAVREAKNKIRVLDQIRIRTGLEVRVLSNSEQRFLSYEAIAAAGAPFETLVGTGTAIVDVGSGSLQISLYDAGKLQVTQNIKLGALRIREMLSDVESSPSEKARMFGELIDNDVHTFRKFYLSDRRIRNIIGVGDSIDLLANRVLHGEEKDAQISAEKFKSYYEPFLTYSTGDLAKKYDLSEEQISVIFPALMCYDRVLETTGASTVWIPGANLCDGIVADYAIRKKLISLNHDFTEDILESARNISRRYQGSEAHGKALEKNVCALFDAMKKYHGMGKRERLLLQLAAILHDCGKYINMNQSAECSYSIIMATEIIGLSHREREIVANVVRCNNLEHADYDDLSAEMDDEMCRLVTKLTAILRVGNALDRSHKQKFKDIQISFKNQEMIITTKSGADIRLEQGLFERKADFFEEVYGIRPALRRTGEK